MNLQPLHCILLIEDDAGDALLLKEMLEQQKCKASIVVAQRLSEGINYLRQNRYDVVLLDLNLPDSHGLSTVTRLLEASSSTPIVVLTGLSDESIGVEAVKCGAQDFLQKGDIDGRLLKRVMFYAVERKKQEIVLKEARDLFERQARVDYLTGAYNRLMFSELFEAEIQRARRYGSDLSLIMLDLDHFKNVNDTYGHETGDHVLKEIAELVSQHIRRHDVFARWGGEEFMLLVPKCDLSQSVQLAEKLRLLCESYDFGDGLKVTASLGVTQFQSGDSAETFKNRTDEALYLAKKSGRNCVVSV